MKLVNLDVEINRICNEICGCDREHCQWKAYGEDEGCNQIQELEKARVVEAIPVEWIEEKIKYMKQDCESDAREVIQSLVYWWRAEQKGWR